MKESKILEITKTKERENEHGKLFYITLRLENGEYITLGKKKADAFKVGQEIKYEEVEKGKKWKEVKENWWNAKNQKVDIIIAAFQIAFGATNLANSYSDRLCLADKLISEMESRINGTNTKSQKRKEVEEMNSDQELEVQREGLMEDEFPF